MNKDEAGRTVLVLLIVFILSSFIVIVIEPYKSDTDSSSNISTESKKKDKPDKTAAKVMGRDFVKEVLKAPATADFPWRSTNKVVTKLSANKFKYESYVDAENSFGAKIRTHFEVILKYKGNEKWELVSIDTWK